MSKRMFFLSVVAVVLFSLSVFAVDGVVLINQASVNAAGGFPYKITVSGSYKLSSNLVLTVGGVDAIDINADNVVLDLNGFSITSVDTICTGTPVASCISTGFTSGVLSNKNNISVMNGNVTGFRIGVSLNGAGATARGITATANNIGINVRTGTIVDSKAVGNQDGLLVQHGAILNCLVQGNPGQGLTSSGGVISGNDVNGNGQGIDVFGPANITNNLISNNTVWGMNVFSGAQAGYGSNTFSNSAGLDIIGTGGTSMHNNVCSGAVC